MSSSKSAFVLAYAWCFFALGFCVVFFLQPSLMAFLLVVANLTTAVTLYALGLAKTELEKCL